MRKLWLIFLFILLNFSGIIAQFSAFYMIIQHGRSVDPVSVALGLSGVAYGEGVFSPYSNPAGLAFIAKPTIAGSFYPSGREIWFEDPDFARQISFTGAYPVQKFGVMGVSLVQLGLGEFTTTDEFGNLVETKKTGIRQAQITMATHHRIFEKLDMAWGVNVKYLNLFYNIEDITAVLFDVGVRAGLTSNSRRFMIGFSVSNLGGDISYEGGINNQKINEPAVRLMRVGLAYDHHPITAAIEKMPVSYLITLEYQKSINDYNPSYNIKLISSGLQLMFFNHLFARLGYFYDFYYKEKDPDFKSWTYGIGFRTPEKLSKAFPVKIEFNYSRGYQFGVWTADVISLGLIYK